MTKLKQIINSEMKVNRPEVKSIYKTPFKDWFPTEFKQMLFQKDNVEVLCNRAMIEGPMNLVISDGRMINSRNHKINLYKYIILYLLKLAI